MSLFYRFYNCSITGLERHELQSEELLFGTVCVSQLLRIKTRLNSNKEMGYDRDPNDLRFATQ